MYRILEDFFKQWKKSVPGAPILLKGARQVGKTYLARKLGSEFQHFDEINFEKNPQFKELFQKDLDPKRILRDLALSLNQTFRPGESLLFLDEIHECPAAIKALRYFKEELPELHLIAAGSLLEFELEKIGMPVGRVDYLTVYPMNWHEFLLARGFGQLAAACQSYQLLKDNAFPTALHHQLNHLLGEYIAIGGMPEVVERWVSTQDFNQGLKNTHVRHR